MAGCGGDVGGAGVVLGVGEGRPPWRPPAASGRPGSADPPRRRPFHLYLGVLAVFSLGNSSDAFLLLKAQEAGVGLVLIPLLWTFHHVVKAAASTHGGMLADRRGRKGAILAGWLVYALAYAGFASAASAGGILLPFRLHGLVPALTEGPER